MRMYVHVCQYALTYVRVSYEHLEHCMYVCKCVCMYMCVNNILSLMWESVISICSTACMYVYMRMYVHVCEYHALTYVRFSCQHSQHCVYVCIYAYVCTCVWITHLREILLSAFAALHVCMYICVCMRMRVRNWHWNPCSHIRERRVGY